MGNSANDCESPIKKDKNLNADRHSREGCEIDAMNQEVGGLFRVCSGASLDDAVCDTETLAKHKNQVTLVTCLVH